MYVFASVYVQTQTHNTHTHTHICTYAYVFVVCTHNPFKQKHSLAIVRTHWEAMFMPCYEMERRAPRSTIGGTIRVYTYMVYKQRRV